MSIVEGNCAFLTVHKDPNPLRSRGHAQWGPWLGACRVLCIVAQTQGPVPIIGAQLHPCLSINCFQGNTYIPLGLGANTHLPVMSACMESLGTENINTLNEALRIGFVRQHGFSLDYLGPVSRELEAWMNCVLIIGQRKWA